MSQQLKDRTKALAVRIIKMARSMPRGLVEDVLAKQVIRCATSVGANYRSALRGRSSNDFISRITVVEEEADETCYWLELLIAVQIFPAGKVELLLKEAKELTAIFTAAGKTAKQKNKKNNPRK